MSAAVEDQHPAKKQRGFDGSSSNSESKTIFTGDVCQIGDSSASSRSGGGSGGDGGGSSSDLISAHLAECHPRVMEEDAVVGQEEEGEKTAAAAPPPPPPSATGITRTNTCTTRGAEETCILGGTDRGRRAACRVAV